MITPALSDFEHPSDSDWMPKSGWTTFQLHLAPSENGNDLSAQLRDVRPTLLLFLRKLRALSISIPATPPHNAIDIEVRRTDDVDRDMVSLERIRDGEHTVERYVLVRHLAQTPEGEPGREDIKESEIVLAFPVTEAREPMQRVQDVHAFLPLRCYGFKVCFPGLGACITVLKHDLKSSSFRRTSSPPLAGRMSWQINHGIWPFEEVLSTHFSLPWSASKMIPRSVTSGSVTSQSL